MRRPAMLLLTPLFCLTLATCHDSLGPTAPRGPRLPPRLVTVEDTLVASGDTHLSKTSPNQNFGTNDGLKVGGSSRFRVLVQFDSALIRQAVGAGQLDSARLEFTIQANPDGFGSGGRQVDLHRLTRSWTELGATWNCPVDVNTANSVPDCPGTGWDMTNQGQAPYVTTRTARVTITNGQTGVIRLDVTQDVAGFLAGTVHRGWIFRKYTESEGGQALVFSREAPQQPRLILAVTINPVPAQAPDTIPAWVYADTNISPGSAIWPNRFVKQIVVVLFQPTATPAQRQAAIDLVGGEVIGGSDASGGLIEGEYFVRVPDPGDGSNLDQASRILSSLPYVGAASIEVLVGPNWTRAQDGPGWTVWQTSPDRADGDNWAAEVIAAPRAWGCTTGDSTVPLAVVDRDFQGINEIDSNAVMRHGDFIGPSSADDHGTNVASLIAARGNNDSLMTGVSWRARLRLYDYAAGVVPGTYPDWGLRSVIDEIVRASIDGADVINVSAGVHDYLTPPSFSDTLVVGSIDRLAQRLQRRLEFLTAIDLRPLVVLSAGNDALDAYWSALPAAKNPVTQGQILVVGGIRRLGSGFAQSDSSNIGALVDLWAPGKVVYFLNGLGVVDSGSGTSYAAPLVTGIAGLLLSQDPTLSADSLKHLIMTGANTSLVPGLLVPDAYTSLKLLSTRSGQPLCGNEVWVAGGQLKARRGGSVEVLATLNDSAGLVNVLHGGRRVDVYADLGGKRSFLFNATTRGWNEHPNPYALPDTLPGGTYVGALWASHDGDSTVSVVPAPSGVPGAFEVRLRTGGVITKTWTVSAALANTTHWEVTRRDWWASDSSYHDTDSAQAGTIQTASARPAFSPEGRRLLVAVNREQHQVTVSPDSTVCPGSIGPDPPSYCRSQQQTTSTLPNEVWEIPLPPGSPQSIGSTGGTHLFWLGEAEDGGRLVSGTGVHQASATVTPLPGGGWQTTITSDQWLTCTVEFRQTGNLSFLNSELSAEACSPFEAAGSLAPLRAGGAGPGTVPRPPRRGRR